MKPTPFFRIALLVCSNLVDWNVGKAGHLEAVMRAIGHTPLLDYQKDSDVLEQLADIEVTFVDGTGKTKVSKIGVGDTFSGLSYEINIDDLKYVVSDHESKVFGTLIDFKIPAFDCYYVDLKGNIAVSQFSVPAEHPSHISMYWDSDKKLVYLLRHKYHRGFYKDLKQSILSPDFKDTKRQEENNFENKPIYLGLYDINRSTKRFELTNYYQYPQNKPSFLGTVPVGKGGLRQRQIESGYIMNGLLVDSVAVVDLSK